MFHRPWRLSVSTLRIMLLLYIAYLRFKSHFIYRAVETWLVITEYFHSCLLLIHIISSRASHEKSTVHIQSSHYHEDGKMLSDILSLWNVRGPMLCMRCLDLVCVYIIEVWSSQSTKHGTSYMTSYVNAKCRSYLMFMT